MCDSMRDDNRSVNPNDLLRSAHGLLFILFLRYYLELSKDLNLTTCNILFLRTTFRQRVLVGYGECVF